MKRILIFILFLLNGGFFCVSCNNATSSTEFEFYYYPQKNVYYDVQQKYFLYSLDGAKTWQTVESSDGNVELLGRKVVVYGGQDDIYQENDEHRKLYTGNLVNIVSADTASAFVSPQVSARKVVMKSKPVVDDSVANEEKPAKGIKKLIKNIFGKKNKDK